MTYRWLQCSGAWAVHFTERTQRLSLLQLSPAKNPEVSRDCQPTPELSVLLLLYTGIIDGRRKVRTRTYLLCFTWPRTKASSLLARIPVITETPPWQVLQNHSKTCPKACDVNISVLARGKERYRGNELTCAWSNSTLVTPVWALWDPWTSPLHLTSHSTWTWLCTHPNHRGIPCADTGQTELLQRGHQFWHICKRLFEVQSVLILMCGKKIGILFLERGWIVHLPWPRFHQYNILSIQKLGQRTWGPNATTEPTWTSWLHQPLADRQSYPFMLVEPSWRCL